MSSTRCRNNFGSVIKAEQLCISVLIRFNANSESRF
jgi:hypothetical protein